MITPREAEQTRETKGRETQTCTESDPAGFLQRVHDHHVILDGADGGCLLQEGGLASGH